MADTNKSVLGTFCWVELSTPNPDGAKKFYAELLGWQYKDEPMPQGGAYTMVRTGDKDVGGLYMQHSQQTSEGVPPHWLSYVAVENTDQTTERAKTLGAKILAPPFDVMEAGRMSVLSDPTGAVLALWQGKKHTGSTAGYEPGQFCWNELMTRDSDRAGKFYVDLFGWKPTVRQIGTLKYTQFSVGAGMPFAGMIEIAKEWGPVPSNWMVYFSVADCDKTCEKAKQIGGTVSRPPHDIPEVGRFAILADPQNAYFSIIKLNPRS